MSLPTFSYLFLPPTTSSFIFYGLVWYGLVRFDMVCYCFVFEGGSHMTSEFIHKEMSMLFCLEKFSGWVGGGGFAIIATSSRFRSPGDLR